MGNSITDTYLLAMVDKATRPLAHVMEAAEKSHKTLEKLEKLTGGSGLKMVGLIAGTKAASLALGGLKIAAGVAMVAVTGVLGALAAGASAAWHFGKGVVEAAKFSQQSKTSLDIFLGEGKGEHAFNRALAFGNVLPMKETDLVKQFQALAGAGYTGQRLDAANAGLADIQALRGDKYRENLEFHFLRLKNEAKPDAKDVKMAAIDTGIGMEGLMTELFHLKGVKVPKTIIGMEALYESMKKSGKVTGVDVADAILHGIDNRFNGGQGLGTSAKRIGMGSLAGLLSNLENAWERFQMQIGVEKFAGIQSLMHFLQRILVYFDLATPQGQKLAQVVERLTNALFGGLDSLDSEALDKFFSAGVAAAETLVDALNGAWDIVNKLLHGDWADLGGSVLDALEAVAQVLGGAIVKGVMHVLPKSLGGEGGGAHDSWNQWQWRQQQARFAKESGRHRDDIMDKGLLPIDMVDTAHAERGSMAWLLSKEGGAWAAKNAAEKAAKGATTSAEAPEPVSAADYLRRQGVAVGGDMEEVGAQGGEGLKRGARKSLRSNSPSLEMEEIGADAIDGLFIGLRRKVQEMKDGGGHTDSTMEELVHLLRGSAARVGAPVR